MGRWVVHIDTEYNKIDFIFESANQAIEFAEMAKISAQPYEDYKGNVYKPRITIAADILTRDKEDE